MNGYVVVFGLVGALAWGLWAFFADLATQSMEPEAAMVLSYLSAIAIGGLYVVRQGTQLAGHGFTPTGFAIAAGIASGVGAISYYAALQIGSAGVATTLTAMYFVVAAVLGIVFLGDSLAWTDVAGIALAACAVVLIAQ